MSPLVNLIEDGFAQAVDRAAHVLNRGGVVVFPTETFYGLAARADDLVAVRFLAELKGRESNKPMPVIAASLAHIEAIAQIPAPFKQLATAFWPGPLTLTLATAQKLPPHVLGPGSTLGVRVSSHPFAAALAAASGGLITATSANPAGRPPAVTADELERVLTTRADLVVDGGTLPGGAPSTVVGLRNGEVIILRAGAISEAAIHDVLAGKESQARAS